jgi:peptidoglycan/xylan/chitin deacetylase (PgdA/CDA1 family)
VIRCRSSILSVVPPVEPPVADRSVGLAPALLYPAKAALTHGRAAAWAARGARSTPGPRILYYHRVSAELDELAVAPDRFRRQMHALADAGLRGVETLEAVGPAGAGVVGLNFDDGYRDVADHALPVLKELGFRATVFVATGVTDGRARFEWYGARQPPLLSWDEIGELDAAGTLRFEPHTVSHRNLLTLSDVEAEHEIAGSKRELEERLGRSAEVFCYPAGLFGARERALVERAGFTAAVSCEPGVNDSSVDRLALRRIQVDHRDLLLDFRAKVGGAFDRPPPLRAAWRRRRYGMPPASSRS